MTLILHAVGKVASFALSLWPSGLTSDLFNDPADALWNRPTRKQIESGDLYECVDSTCGCHEDTRYARRPRVVEGRGLDADEQDAEWTDKYGFTWAFKRGTWVTEYDGMQPASYTPYPWFAPYTEIVDDVEDEHSASDADCSRAEGLDRASQPTSAGQPSHIAEVPSGPELRAHSPEGQLSLTCSDFMDAARALRECAPQFHPTLRPHSEQLAERFELAAFYTPR